MPGYCTDGFPLAAPSEPAKTPPKLKIWGEINTPAQALELPSPATVDDDPLSCCRVAAVLAVATALAGTTLAQSPEQNLPPCAQQCVNKFTSGSEIGGCQAVNAACICANPDFLSNIACCLAGACSVADQQAATTFALNFCKIAGVTNLPTAVSCVSSTATATGSGTAAAGTSASAPTTTTGGSASSASSSASTSASAAATTNSSSSGSASSSAAAATTPASQASSASSSASASASKSSSASANVGPQNAAGMGAGILGGLAAAVVLL
ncbi:hypothetical protein DH86_00000119 [Scytalidium sp. 3C]|nr:hypothetical protein DH86_00000119 [Scytalidium sp. 3C]